MSRVANRLIDLPAGVTVSVSPGAVTVKGAKGSLTVAVSAGVSVVQEDKKLSVRYQGDDSARVRAGATRAHLANMVHGVTSGYERKLELVGVGFRAAVAGKCAAPETSKGEFSAFANVGIATSSARPCSTMVHAVSGFGMTLTVSSVSADNVP